MSPSSSDTGSLARRLREDAGLGVRALASALDVTHSAVARAERGDPALGSLAERAVEHLLELHTGGTAGSASGVVGEKQAPYLRFEGRAGEHLARLLEVERGWRRALVRGVLEEHGLAVEAEGATAKATVRTRSAEAEQTEDEEQSDDDEQVEGEGPTVLRFDLDRGRISVGRHVLYEAWTSPYERADRDGWGRRLEQVAALYRTPGAGWAERDHDEAFTLVIPEDEHTDDEP